MINRQKIPTEETAMKPSTPKTEMPPLTQLRNVVSGVSLNITRPSEAMRKFPHRKPFAFLVTVAVALLYAALTTNTTSAATYYSTYGQSRTTTVTLTASGTHKFEVDGIASNKNTEWYVGGVYKETDYSGTFAIDPDYSWTFASGTTAIKAIVYNSDWSVRETHIWNVSVRTIISAYWLTPVYVTEGTIVTTRAQVTGFSVGDQFAFEIREDDYPLSSDYVTTRYGNVYSSGGNLYVDATWTSVWQSDQSGDPEFYCIASRGGVSKESSRSDANEMHVARGPALSRSPASLSQSVTQGQNAFSQSFSVWNSGGSTLSYSISDNASWLSVSPTTGTSTGEQDSLTINYSTAGLLAGTYNATITITASGASGSPQTVSVTLTVNPPPQTIISAYWLAPVYVTEGTVVTMRAQVSGYNVGDQFAFEIREDDYPLSSDYVTTRYGNVYSSGGNLYVDATWTSVWQSDQSGDPEFYCIASRGGVSKESSRSDANEMHVARGPALSRSPASLSQSVTQGQNAPSQSFEVWNSGGGTLSYSITDNATWLSASPGSGTSTGEHDSITVNYSTTGLVAGTYNATITISAGGSAQPVSVTLTVNPPPQTIVSAYWLAPVYVTEGTVVTMRAQVAGFSVGDQFAFEIREDDGILGSDYVTTRYGNVYSSSGNYYVDATWPTAWQSDQSGNPEFYFVVSRGSAALASSTVDANEMHVTQALDPYGVGALEPAGIGLFSTIPVEHRNNLTDLANLKSNGLYYGSRLVNSTDRKLIIAIHGWNGTPLTGISGAIDTAIVTGRIDDDWRVIAYDWSNDADTGDTYWTSESNNANSAATKSGGQVEPTVYWEGGATEAAEHAYQHGLLLGAKILQQVGANNLDSVQLIGHSAGSWTVYGALRYLSANAPATTQIQVTYLDPYIPADVIANNNANFKRALQEASPNYCRITGQSPVKAEQYWAEDITAGTDTPYSFTSQPSVVFRTDGFPYGDANWDGHSGPVTFYADTINDPNHSQASGHGWKHSLAHNEDITSPTVTINSPTSGQTFTSSPITVSGSASDPGSPSSGVALVEVRVNGGSWQAANGTTSWICPVSLLVSGDYMFEARSRDNAGNYSTIALVRVTYNAPDTTPPSPNPSTWATAPNATGPNSIQMAATTVSDSSGVQYYFHCLTGGGHDSGWQASAAYQDTGLSPGTTYSYQVRTRDQSANQNTGSYSSTLAATTQTAPTRLAVRITSITGAGTTSVAVNWTNTLAGTNYTLQYNTNLNAANWYDVRTVMASGTTASLIDHPAVGDPKRYYRVKYLSD